MSTEKKKATNGSIYTHVEQQQQHLQSLRTNLVKLKTEIQRMFEESEDAQPVDDTPTRDVLLEHEIKMNNETSPPATQDTLDQSLYLHTQPADLDEDFLSVTVTTTAQEPQPVESPPQPSSPTYTAKTTPKRERTPLRSSTSVSPNVETASPTLSPTLLSMSRNSTRTEVSPLTRSLKRASSTSKSVAEPHDRKGNSYRSRDAARNQALAEEIAKKRQLERQRLEQERLKKENIKTQMQALKEYVHDVFRSPNRRSTCAQRHRTPNKSIASNQPSTSGSVSKGSPVKRDPATNGSKSLSPKSPRPSKSPHRLPTPTSVPTRQRSGSSQRNSHCWVVGDSEDSILFENQPNSAQVELEKRLARQKAAEKLAYQREMERRRLAEEERLNSKQATIRRRMELEQKLIQLDREAKLAIQKAKKKPLDGNRTLLSNYPTPSPARSELGPSPEKKRPAENRIWALMRPDSPSMSPRTQWTSVLTSNNPEAITLSESPVTVLKQKREQQVTDQEREEQTKQQYEELIISLGLEDDAPTTSTQTNTEPSSHYAPEFPSSHDNLPSEAERAGENIKAETEELSLDSILEALRSNVFETPPLPTPLPTDTTPNTDQPESEVLDIMQLLETDQSLSPQLQQQQEQEQEQQEQEQLQQEQAHELQHKELEQEHQQDQTEELQEQQGEQNEQMEQGEQQLEKPEVSNKQQGLELQQEQQQQQMERMTQQHEPLEELTRNQDQKQLEQQSDDVVMHVLERQQPGTNPNDDGTDRDAQSQHNDLHETEPQHNDQRTDAAGPIPTVNADQRQTETNIEDPHSQFVTDTSMVDTELHEGSIIEDYERERPQSSNLTALSPEKAQILQKLQEERTLLYKFTKGGKGKPHARYFFIDVSKQCVCWTESATSKKAPQTVRLVSAERGLTTLRKETPNLKIGADVEARSFGIHGLKGSVYVTAPTTEVLEMWIAGLEACLAMARTQQ